jgi:hypothetical protein
MPRAGTFAHLFLLALLLAGCPSPNDVAPMPSRRVSSIVLPDLPEKGGASLDFIAYDAPHKRVWVPAGNTGEVDIIDVVTGTVVSVKGFPTATVERDGVPHVVGPSSVSVGIAGAFIGNRADSSVCFVGGEPLAKEACLVLDSPPDSVTWVASQGEVWVTTPRDNSIRILDAFPDRLVEKEKIALPGKPEGAFSDEERGVLYTSLEDKDLTLVINVQSRHITRTWEPGCGEEGPRGLAMDRVLGVLFVACTTQVVAIDAHDGSNLVTFPVGAGIDGIDYFEPRHELFVPAGKEGKLAVVRFDPPDKMALEESVPTVVGARTAVVTEKAVAYLIDPAEGKILVVTQPPPIKRGPRNNPRGGRGGRSGY